MSSVIAKKILSRFKQPELLTLLTETISGSELNSLLLEVFKKRSSEIKPPQLLNHYMNNRLVKPADLPVIALREMELDYLRLFEMNAFPAIELSPVTSLGSCSVVATADQNK